MSKLPGRSLLPLVVAFLALYGLVSPALAGDTVYIFHNTSNHPVTLYLNYPPGAPPTAGAIRQMTLKAGDKWQYTMDSSTPNLRLDLSGGKWKDFKSTIFMIGANSGAAPAGTYVIQ